MITHEIKILPVFYEAVANGSKTFELRFNDRHYKVGDLLVLKEWDGSKFTGRSLNKYITYILTGHYQYSLALHEGYVCLSLSDFSMGE